MSVIGEPLTRVDGRLKVTGRAKYVAEFDMPKLAYAELVTSTVANGQIMRMESAAAERAPGVLLVMTPANAPRLPNGGNEGVKPPAGRMLSLLQNTDVRYNNQPIAVVVAETLEQARYAASLVRVRYQSESAMLDFNAGFASAHQPKKSKDPADVSRGDVETALREAAVKSDQVYITPKQNHNPMEPHATIAKWDGDHLTLWDTTQYINGVKPTVARAFGLPAESVRVICPYVGGGFGSKGSTWSHVVLTAMAAKQVNRPVRMVLEREQMFGPVGGRPQTHQRVELAATREGRLTGTRHDVYAHTSVLEDFLEPSAVQTRMLYASPALITTHHLVPLTVGTPTFQRAPGEASGTFALEAAMDELAEAMQMDPLALRMANYAESDPQTSKPFTSKHLRECYTKGAGRFGWERRSSKPRSMREGHELIGMGMATATYPANRSAAMASIQLLPEGGAIVASGTQDLGTGTYTIMVQVAADSLGLSPEMVEAKLGDSMLPKAPVSGGSQSAASVTPAVRAAAEQVRLKLYNMAMADAASPLKGAQVGDLDFKDGRIFLKSNPATGENFTALLQRHGGQPVEATASAEPDQDHESYSAHSFGAVFAEVAVDETLGMRRVVGVYDVGKLLNGKTGRSQLIGGIVWGVSFALHEQSHVDARYGRVVNNNLAEYHVPVNADIGEIDVMALDIPDMNFNPLGARGIGEIGITGVAAAVANAIYNATGKRQRETPITPDKLMA